MGIAGFPQEFADRAATILGHGLEVSVTMRQAGVSVRAGSSTEAAARCDQAEALDDRGPCIDAMDHGGRRVVTSVTDAPGWERWSRQCVEEGFLTAAAVPAAVTADVAVALNLYSRAPDPWTPELLTAADAFAQLVASAVGLRLELAALEDSTAGFYRDMSDAVATERAVGAIMQTNRCSADEARRIIDSASRHRNVSPREVAESLLRALVVEDAPDPADDDPGLP
ncbi:ANTAR domain-containing protein [Cellulosimicrobium cellulans]|uniref:ANTAR domain-containing protein n=1 Tax=Cellulosimicrobium cellulans TaxID=1710 RepID=UPI002149B95E|nr:ANTAR domain-containing protein [Cellulosimicrobium cellulans]